MTDLRPDIARSVQVGQRVIWQFVDRPGVIRRPPAAEGAEFAPEVDPALINWDRFISGGPSVIATKTSDCLLQFPTWEQAVMWLYEGGHVWVVQDPMPEAMPGFYERSPGAQYVCASCGVWGANGEWERGA